MWDKTSETLASGMLSHLYSSISSAVATLLSPLPHEGVGVVSGLGDVRRGDKASEPLACGDIDVHLDVRGTSLRYTRR